MAEQQDLLTAEAPPLAPEAGAAMPGLAPEGGLTPPPGGEVPAEGPPGLDLDSLLMDIDKIESPAAEAPGAPSGRQELLDAINSARDEVARQEELENQDGVTRRFTQLEQELIQMKQEKAALSQQNARERINATIDTAIADEASELGLDIRSATGKAFGKLLRNSAHVAVAKEQARTPGGSVDLTSVQQTTALYTKLIKQVATELATKIVANERRAPSGATKQPHSPSKPVGELTNAEFDKVVLAAITGSAS